MVRRHDLNALLKTLTENDNVYFQPPESMKINYPCIIYKLDRLQKFDADNKPYFRKKGYQVTVIDRNPDSEIPDKVGALPENSFERAFTSDGLHHFVFNLYY